MKFTSKLFIYVLPLIILPLCIIAVLAYTMSVKTVTSLSRDKLLAEAEHSASSIDSIFAICEKDLESMWQFFFEQLFSAENADSYGVNLQKLTPALQKFKNSSPIYLQIGFWNVSGNRIISSDETLIRDYLTPQQRKAMINANRSNNDGYMPYDTPVSKVFYSDRHRSYVVTVHKTFYDSFGTLLGALMIDLDFNLITQLATQMPQNENYHGFVFLVDHNGETIYHPDHEPYSMRFTQYRDPVMREFIISTVLGRPGFRIYTPVDGSPKNMAAYAPIKTAGWTLVKTVPLSEFTESAVSLRNYIIQIGVLILLIAISVFYFLAYQLNKPLLDLTKATRQLASGNLDVAEVKIAGTSEAAALTCNFNTMARNLRRIQAELVATEKMVSLGRLSAGVAHELRNPLNAIKLTLLYMKRHRLDEAAFAEATQILNQEIDRLNKFVTDFLYFARETPPEKTLVDVAAILQKMVLLNHARFTECGIELEMDIAPNLPQAKLDEYQIMQVFMNIVNNTIDAMPEGGKLIVKAEEHLYNNARKGIKITFIDNGKGFDEATLASLFDPFFTTKKTGTGLGLAISQSLIEAHGGLIYAANRKDTRGAEITVFLAL